MLGHKRGVVGLKPTALKCACRSGRDSALNRHSLAHICKTCDIAPVGAAPHSEDACDETNQQPRVICLSCPSCNACELSSHRAFQLEDLDKRCTCSKCGNNIKAMSWNCMCRKPWHLCQIHKHCHTSGESLSQSKPCKKARNIATMTHEELVVHENKRARQGPYHISYITTPS